MIALVCAFLVAFYVIKIFFPEWFVLQVENERLIKIGSFIDQHWWAYEILCIITSFITYYLYLGAVKQKLLLGWKEIVAILCVMVITHLSYWFEPSFYTNLCFVSFVVLPLINFDKECYKRMTLCVAIHFLCQVLSLNIRNITSVITNFNSITLLMLTLECYFWLLLLYLYFNYNKIFKKGE